MRHIKKYRLSGIAIIFVILWVILIGPWPVSNPDWQHSSYASSTLKQLQQLPTPPPAGAVRAGAASVEINLLPGDPIGGFKDRPQRRATGSLDKLFMKAVSFAQAGNQADRIITIAGGDYLLPLPELITRVTELTGLSRNSIFFTASHTHSGPGGYAHGYIEQLTLGDYEPAVLEKMAQALSQAIMQSRQQLEPVQLAIKSYPLPGKVLPQLIHNYVKPTTLVNDRLHLLQLRASSGVIATLLTFSAHPTLMGVQNTYFSADYPGVVQRQLEAEFKSPVMFMAGAMGSMMPYTSNRPSTNASQHDDVQQLGNRLARIASEQLNKPDIQTLDTAVIAAHVLPVTLPPPNFHLNKYLRASPWFVNALFHDRETFIHALRIGPVVMLAYPADYSGELAIATQKQFNDRDILPWIISFNGDYIGYLNPSARYGGKAYITRSAEVFGKWGGDYMKAMGEQLIEKMHSQP